MGRALRDRGAAPGGTGVNIQPLELAGCFLVEVQAARDERGLFARTFCEQEFSAHGMETRFVQCGCSFNALRGTLRGMHLQIGAHAEAKLIRCTAGRVHDVLVDLRRDSPSFGRWQSVELCADARNAVYAARGVAHGFLTLCDGAELLYQLSNHYAPAAARGVRYDDPSLAIAWPFEPSVMSEADRHLPHLHTLLGELEHGVVGESE